MPRPVGGVRGDVTPGRCCCGAVVSRAVTGPVGDVTPCQGDPVLPHREPAVMSLAAVTSLPAEGRGSDVTPGAPPAGPQRGPGQRGQRSEVSAVPVPPPPPPDAAPRAHPALALTPRQAPDAAPVAKRSRRPRPLTTSREGRGLRGFRSRPAPREPYGPLRAPVAPPRHGPP